MIKVTNHLGKDLKFVKKLSYQCRTEPPPTLRNYALTGTSVDVMLDLNPGDVLVIHPSHRKGDNEE